MAKIEEQYQKRNIEFPQQLQKINAEYRRLKSVAKATKKSWELMVFLHILAAKNMRTTDFGIWISMHSNPVMRYSLKLACHRTFHEPQVFTNQM